MCLGIPGQIVAFLDATRQLARVDVSGVHRTIHVGILHDEPLDPGDWVLIHTGIALSRIEADDALRTIEFLDALTRGDERSDPWPQ